eukprot:m.139622 g.139622  ORF g.139622 m.139622 type:complete len:536 (-) comp17063_c1_seq3:122-1729(-)
MARKGFRPLYNSSEDDSSEDQGSADVESGTGVRTASTGRASAPKSSMGKISASGRRGVCPRWSSPGRLRFAVAAGVVVVICSFAVWMSAWETMNREWLPLRRNNQTDYHDAETTATLQKQMPDTTPAPTVEETTQSRAPSSPSTAATTESFSAKATTLATTLATTTPPTASVFGSHTGAQTSALQPRLASSTTQDAERQFTLELTMSNTFEAPLPRVAFLCQQFDLGSLVDAQVIKFRGIVFDHEDDKGTFQVVHHIDLFLCTDELGNKFSRPDHCEHDDGWLGPGEACYPLLAAHDRGAAAFLLPDGVGLRVGPQGTPYARVVMQVHYLFPSNRNAFDLEDTTTAEITVTPDLRPNDAAAVALLDFDLKVPTNNADFKYSFSCPASYLETLLEQDLDATTDGLTFFATHLHAHAHGKQLYAELIRNGSVIGEYGRIDNYGGYGPDQTVQLLSTDAPKFLRGDSLKAVCHFDSRGLSSPLVYGVEEGEEMCGFVLFYYPHDASQLYERDNMCLLKASFFRKREPDEMRVRNRPPG